MEQPAVNVTLRGVNGGVGKGGLGVGVPHKSERILFA